MRLRPFRRFRLPHPATAALTALALTFAAPAPAQDRALPARLDGIAVLPAGSALKPPADAPPLLLSTGKFASDDGRRVEALGAIPVHGMPGLPVLGQPLQGISGLRHGPQGSYWAITDNGLGARTNSVDAMPAIHRLRPDWSDGAVRHLETIWLSDPDRLMPWPITLEGTDRRYLTGADIDPESLVAAGDGFWVGEEFGPWLLRFDTKGRLIGLWEAVVDGRPVRSPDHPSMRLPAKPDGKISFDIARSRGFEGMTASADGRYLYALLEGPVWREGKPETFADGKPRLRWLEFDVAADSGSGGWTGRSWTYTLERDGNAIGEVTWLDQDRALVLERDEGEGDAARACPDANTPRPDCYPRPARFKRLYMVTRAGVKDGGALRKLGHVDLLAIQDPEVHSGSVGGEGRFNFPFATIESVERVGDSQVLIANDNNFPYSAGRTPGTAEDTEFILLSVPELLALK
ncbi:esterase-like activity of phytase family protein [Indioceanicola profundi]|uniref:esterase-like activity of phytase family protein n=1 Tax=Indioceanicola profundi TaxID=2220096 RepID=UPI000E6A9B66|nr:esterase-like activity of phytase family protein [Indioceanicola profundi]